MNTGPLDIRTQIYHLNSRLVWYSDGYCTYSHNLIYRLVWYPDYRHVFHSWMVCYSNAHIQILIRNMCFLLGRYSVSPKHRDNKWHWPEAIHPGASSRHCLSQHWTHSNVSTQTDYVSFQKIQAGWYKCKNKIWWQIDDRYSNIIWIADKVPLPIQWGPE